MTFFYVFSLCIILSFDDLENEECSYFSCLSFHFYLWTSGIFICYFKITDSVHLI